MPRSAGIDPAAIPTSGIDGVTDAMLAVKAGEHNISILQDAKAQAEGALDIVQGLILPSVEAGTPNRTEPTRQMTKTRVAIGSDEAGFDLKEALKTHLTAAEVEVLDYGCDSPDPVDYPDIALELAHDIAAHKMERGILICGTGIGMAITANKVPGVRAAQAHDAYSAQRARKSNDAQIVTLGARVIAPELAKTIVDTWLASEFEGGNSTRKVDKIVAFDAQRGRTADDTDPDPETR